MASHLLAILVTFSLLSLSSAAATTTTCKSKSFATEKFTAYDNCNDLPTLGAVLHWTYDSSSSLTVAFSAAPPTADGWVSFALNPKATGMVGAQSLIAFKPTSSGPVSVSTYDIQSYHAIVKGPISYKVTNTSAEESNGQITIFATWALPKGSKTVNQVWQVGPVVNGKPGKHDFEPANLESTMELALVTEPSSGLTQAPAVSPVAGGEMGGSSALAPVPIKGGAMKIGFGGVFSSVLGWGALLVALF